MEEIIKKSTKRSSSQRLMTLNINQILLDPKNPRLGDMADKNLSQSALVEKIIGDFGIDDLLSSLSVNGYFDAEPIVCQMRDKKYYVIEGNRRLVSCMVLSKDERATKFLKNFTHYFELHDQHENRNVSEIPVVVFPEDEPAHRISAYLGIRHIVSTKDWDSYAKAKWVSETIGSTTLSIDEISTMTGDKSNTIRSLLAGYHFMAQLEAKKRFNRNTTIRKGRGSNVNYPFSWVYTLLSHSAAKEYLNLNFFDETSQPVREPIPAEKLDDAKFVIQSMFGDSSIGRPSLLKDSREITSFAEALNSPEKVHYLKAGKSLEEVKNLTTGLDERIKMIMFSCKDLLNEANSRVIQEPQKVTSSLKEFSFQELKEINNVLKAIRESFERAEIEANDGLDY